VTEASYRLLVVDDEPLALKLVRRVFESETDIQVLADTSPQRCLELAKAHDIDLVIADQRMPEMEGLQFLDQVREVRPRALRILLTAFPDTAVALTAINQGLVYRFILKPWEPEDMLITVRRALETKRLADEHDRVVRQLKSSYDELVQAEQLTALGRLSAGIGNELSHAVGPLLDNVRTLEAQLTRLLKTVRASDRAFEHDFARAQTHLFDTEAVSANPVATGNAEETLAAIRAAGERLDALVRTVGAYAVQTEPEPVDVNQTVLTAMQILWIRFEPAIRVERDLRAVPLARCRRSEILQVVLNLFSNAIEAVEKEADPVVRVRTWSEGSSLRLEIADNGRGLPPAVERRLFQPFVSTKPMGRGSGMGLSICRGIVESHGGTIEAASKPGDGTRFTVTLPALM
jgi:two-component system, NtrC family, sensor kinase